MSSKRGDSWSKPGSPLLPNRTAYVRNKHCLQPGLEDRFPSQHPCLLVVCSQSAAENAQQHAVQA